MVQEGSHLDKGFPAQEWGGNGDLAFICSRAALCVCFIIDWPVEKATVEKYGSEMASGEIFFQLGVTSWFPNAGVKWCAK